jgi:opacity protein-like surface antigen
MHMKQILLASAAAMVVAGTAFAAEPLLEPLPPAAPVVEPFVVPSWAGTYVGADIGWATLESDDDNDFFEDNNGLFDDDDEELDGLVGGVFAGWLGQRGTFLYGVELFGQITDLDDDDDGDFFGDGELTTDGDQCFVDGEQVPCFLAAHELNGLAGLEGMIGWGGERAAFLLHGGAVLGFFDSRDRFGGAFDNNFDDDTETELGASIAAEGRFKLTETVWAGVIGRGIWFPEIGGDDDNGFFDDNGEDDDDLWLFEVKARLGVQFGGVGKAAPLDTGF